MPPKKKSFENIVVQIESEALKRLEELSKQIEDKLKEVSPNDQLVDKIKTECEGIRSITSKIEGHLGKIEILLGIENDW